MKRSFKNDSVCCIHDTGERTNYFQAYLLDGFSPAAISSGIPVTTTIKMFGYLGDITLPLGPETNGNIAVSRLFNQHCYLNGPKRPGKINKALNIL